MNSFIPKPTGTSGFALVVTLSLMILLTIVAVGLLTLSAVSLRSTSQVAAQAEARANARLALMLAIGELQMTMGPDQRVSANGAILSGSNVKHPHWTGVWNSWKAGSSKADAAPDLPSAHQTLPDSRTVANGMNPTYAENRKDHFRSWLLSLNPTEISDIGIARNLELSGSRMPAPNATGVRLVDQGSLGKTAKPEDFVNVRLLKVRSSVSGGVARGRYGWWVGDESQKARILSDTYESNPDTTLAGRLSRHQAPGSTGTRTIEGLKNITDDLQLSSLPTLGTLDLVKGVTDRPAQQNFHHITPFSHQVLSDVREGGLKRDLSSLLERPINPGENGDEFMLYRFDTAGQERVPLQDIAAYYQLYDSTRAGWREGIKYTSAPQNTLLPSGIQVGAPDFGDKSSQDKYLREYTNLYRSPVPIKVQLLLAAKAEPVAPAPNQPSGNTSKSYRLRLGLLPAVTLWNPNNVPIVMNLGDPAVFSQQMRLMYLPFMLRWKKSGYTSEPVSLAYAAMGGNSKTGQPGWNSGGQFIKASIFDMYFSATRPVKLEPGETRVFSYMRPLDESKPFIFRKSQNDTFQAHQEAQGDEWDSEAFLQMQNSAWSANSADANVSNGQLAFRDNDSISFTLSTEKEENKDYLQYQEAQGAGFNFIMIKKLFQSRAGNGGLWGFKNYQFISRTGGGTSTRDFNDTLIKKGYPSGTGPVGSALPVGPMTANTNEWFPFLQFALMADCEVGEALAGPFGGRKFASRPFLHASPLSPPYIDKEDNAALYNYGWNWWVEPINSSMEALVGVSPENRGYYGGGYMDGFGTTHVVQQEIPAAPPISIAALSHARLGGFSLATSAPETTNPTVAAVGFGGLFPHTLQAIGNSYAHPLIAADKAFTPWQRHFNTGSGEKTVTLADHSYLANKALWDEFFFSSISQQPASARTFGNSNRTAKQVAQDFFFNDRPLPNRRIAKVKSGFDKAKLDDLFSETNSVTNGFADKIAAHLMVEGPFNVNSTSVEAWKALFSSLKGKPVAYLDKGQAITSGVTDPANATTHGTPVGPSSLPNGKPYSSDNTAISNPATPEPWYSWRELNDSEIEELAEAIVEQVKLRGPFLSLSEFVNRRLESAKPELAVKGALQAALDDDTVSINAGFRHKSRQLGDEAGGMNAAFPEALKGPVAYGSAAYVDQADLLRNFAAQLTPRGDTYVIRSYGDSLDAAGNVVARAWCEAVVQRVPDYSDPTDEPHVKQAELKSSSNKTFGRQLKIFTFRWLSPDEV